MLMIPEAWQNDKLMPQVGAAWQRGRGGGLCAVRF